jgi:hypothetical protein
MFPDDFGWVKILCLAVAAGVVAHIAINVAQLLIAAWH